MSFILASGKLQSSLGNCSFFFLLAFKSPIQGQRQNSRKGSSCAKKNHRNNPVKSPDVLTPPDTPSTINMGDGKFMKIS